MHYSQEYLHARVARVLILVWWVDPGCMPGIHQSQSYPSPPWAEERKYNERLGVSIRARRNHSPIAAISKTDSIKGN